MRLPLALGVLVSCPFFNPAVPAPQLELELFPIPVEQLTIPAREPDGWKLSDLLREYARVTSQELMIRDDVKARLNAEPVPLDRELTIAPEDVHQVVEALVADAGFIFEITREAHPRLLSVKSTRNNRSPNLRQFARYVPDEELDLWLEHPAFLVDTVLHLENLDVRTLTNSMRATLTDANLEQIIPVGNTHFLLLTGRAPRVATIARLLREVDESEEGSVAESAQRALPVEKAR